MRVNSWKFCVLFDWFLQLHAWVRLCIMTLIIFRNRVAILKTYILLVSGLTKASNVLEEFHKKIYSNLVMQKNYTYEIKNYMTFWWLAAIMMVQLKVHFCFDVWNC